MSTLIPYNYCKVKFYVNIIVFSSCTTPNAILMRFILKITLTTPIFTLMRDHEGLIAASLQFQTCSKVSENLVSTRF